MSTCIILRGPPASGKTTLSEKASQRLGAACLHGDDAWRNSPTRTGDKNDLLKLLATLAKKEIEKGRTVVVDYLFVRAEDVETFRYALGNVTLGIVTLHAPLSTCQQRNDTRQQRNINGAVLSPESVERCHRVLEPLTEGITIATDQHTPDDAATMIAEYARGL